MKSVWSAWRGRKTKELFYSRIAVKKWSRANQNVENLIEQQKQSKTKKKYGNIKITTATAVIDTNSIAEKLTLIYPILLGVFSSLHSPLSTLLTALINYIIRTIFCKNNFIRIKDTKDTKKYVNQKAWNGSNPSQSIAFECNVNSYLRKNHQNEESKVCGTRKRVK